MYPGIDFTFQNTSLMVTPIIKLNITLAITETVIYATADEADAYMFYRCFFAFSVRHKKIPDNRSWKRLNGFS